MSLAFKRIKVYTKLALVLIVALVIGAVFIKNRNHEVRFWFFGLVDAEAEINVVWLILCTAVGAVFSWWVLLAAVSMIKDLRAVRHEEELREREQAQQELAQKLREQEKRIDQKVRKAIGQDADPSD
jgi:hypothetical protein